MTTQNKASQQGVTLREAAKAVVEADDAGELCQELIEQLRAAISQPPAPEQASGERGYCCYGGIRTRQDCASCAKFTPAPLTATPTAAPGGVAVLQKVRKWAEGWAAIPYEDPWKHAAKEILGLLSASPAAPVAAKPEPCNGLGKGTNWECKNRHQCWEPCGELGHSEEHTRPAPKEAQAAVNKALGLAAKPEPQVQAGEPEVVAYLHFHATDLAYSKPGQLSFTKFRPDQQELITLQSHREAMWEGGIRAKAIIDNKNEAIAKKDAALQACSESDAVMHLRALVTALDNAFISSWQSTAAWQKELDLAKDFLGIGKDQP